MPFQWTQVRQTSWLREWNMWSGNETMCWRWFLNPKLTLPVLFSCVCWRGDIAFSPWCDQDREFSILASFLSPFLSSSPQHFCEAVGLETGLTMIPFDSSQDKEEVKDIVMPLENPSPPVVLRRSAKSSTTGRSESVNCGWVHSRTESSSVSLSHTHTHSCRTHFFPL